MMVIVSESVVRAVGGTKDAPKLHRLLGFACTGRHTLYFDPPACLDQWLETIDKGSKDAYQSAIDFGLREGANFASNASTVRIDHLATPVWGDPEATLPLDQALDLLDEKLGFLLEDGTNDWNFVRGIMLKSQRERLQEHVDKGWAEAIHGGGTRILAQLKARLDKPHRGLRTALIFDSDRLHPNELLDGWEPKHAGIGEHQCNAFTWEKTAQEELPLRYWRLTRRFIESYMPKSELMIAAGNTKSLACDAFFSMPKACRWYYNMKKGFANDQKHQERHIDLYRDIHSDHKVALENGFGTDLAEHYQYALQREFNWDEDAREEARINLSRLLRLL